MSKYYNKVIRDLDNYAEPTFNAIDYFEIQYEIAQKDLNISGMNLEVVASKLPSLIDYRFGQLQEIEAIVKYLENKEEKLIGESHKRYMEQYNREISDTTAKRYANIDSDVIAVRMVRNGASLIRNKYIGLLKGLDCLQYQINNVIKIRASGLEEDTFR